MTSVATTPARAPFVSHIFCPLSTKSWPSAVARVLIAATSEPHSGSLIENAPRTSPVAIFGSNRCFCSLVPCWAIMYATMKCVLITPEIDIQPRAICSTTSAYVSSDSPSPPYSSEIVRPNSPISFIPSTIASGNSSLCSSSVACGMISLSTKSLTVRRISCCTSVRPAVWARRAIGSSKGKGVAESIPGGRGRHQAVGGDGEHSPSFPSV